MLQAYDKNKRHLACFTIAQDEPFFLPRWINHYSNQSGNGFDDLYILYHASARPTPRDEEQAACNMQGHGVNVVPVHRIVAFDHDWLRHVVADFCRFLLQSYNWVCFSEVDEWVLPTPSTTREPDSLAVHLEERAGDAVCIRASGYEVVEGQDEPPIDRAAPWLVGQRKNWYPARLYSKTVVTRIPLEWGPGFHELVGDQAYRNAKSPSGDLLLVHLHKLDRGIARERVASSRARKWSEADKAQRLGWQNRAEGAEFDRFFDANVDTGKPIDCLEPIPEELRAIC